MDTRLRNPGVEAAVHWVWPERPQQPDGGLARSRLSRKGSRTHDRSQVLLDEAGPETYEMINVCFLDSWRVERGSHEFAKNPENLTLSNESIKIVRRQEVREASVNSIPDIL